MATASNDDWGPLLFTPEYEVQYEWGPGCTELFETCEKNPGHPNFIPVKQFKKEDIPEPYKTYYCWDVVPDMIKRTVRIVVKYISPERPDKYPKSDKRGRYTTLYGTGYLNGKVDRFEDEPCICPDCIKYGNPKIGYLRVLVLTSKHVVFDENEALKTVVEFGYDSEDRDDVITFYGKEAINESDNEQLDLDMTLLLCVTHDIGLYEKLDYYATSSNQQLPPSRPQLPLIVSHPHGCSKHITIGTKFYHIFKPETSSSTTDPPFSRTVEGRKCRLPLNCSTTSLDLFKKLVQCDTRCVPGVVYRVREGVTVSSYRLDACCSGKLIEPGDDLRDFVKFHPDVEFRCGSGNDIHTHSIPDVEFEEVDGDRDLIIKKPFLHYNEYNIDSCPGSSGAAVNIGGGITLRPHAGFSEDNGMSITGRRRMTLEKEDTKTETT